MEHTQGRQDILRQRILSQVDKTISRRISRDTIDKIFSISYSQDMIDDTIKSLVASGDLHKETFKGEEYITRGV